jgi:hypothetical protein
MTKRRKRNCLTKHTIEDKKGLRRFYWHVSTFCFAMAEAFSHRRVTTEAMVLQASPCGICGEQIATGVLFFLIQYFGFPYSFTHLFPTLYNLAINNIIK